MRVEKQGGGGYLGGELSSAVQPAELATPGGPELEAVAHHTVDGQPPLQVTQALGHMIRSCTLCHAGGKHLQKATVLVSTRLSFPVSGPSVSFVLQFKASSTSLEGWRVCNITRSREEMVIL